VIRAVLDTTTIVSAFPASPGGTLAAIVDRWRTVEFGLVVSEHILAEVERAWTKPYWRARFAPDQVARALALLRQEGEVVPIIAEVSGVATHPEDDPVLATAVSAGVDYLVSGDKQLQRLGRYEGVIILSPRDFLALLEQQAGEEAVATESGGKGAENNAEDHADAEEAFTS
jgi:putative PIN family toxin of toxin-antitoxin system